MKKFKDLNEDQKQDAIVWLIVRSIMALIAVLFILYGFVWKQPCDMDAVSLSCRLTGTVFDILGILLFGGGMLVMSGVFKGLENLYNPIGSSKWNLILGVAMALGIILFWNL